MKLFHHCLSSIGLFGTTLIGASLIGSSPAQAIPESEVIAKLQNIPLPKFPLESSSAKKMLAPSLKKISSFNSQL
jgi:hypothetical protein